MQHTLNAKKVLQYVSGNSNNSKRKYSEFEFHPTNVNVIPHSYILYS